MGKERENGLVALMLATPLLFRTHSLERAEGMAQEQRGARGDADQLVYVATSRLAVLQQLALSPAAVGCPLPLGA